MKPLNRFLLRFILKSEMKRNNQGDGMSGVFYNIQKYMDNNFQHYDTISSHHYPGFQKEKPQTVADFVAKCRRDGALRLEQEKMGLDTGI